MTRTQCEPEMVAGTARFIARCLLVVAHEPGFAALSPPENCNLLRRFLLAAGDTRFVRAVERPLFRAAFHALVCYALPGITLHYLTRKLCLEDWVRSATEAVGQCDGGCRQIVVLGAGLDTLAPRLHGEHPSVRFFEVDRLSTLLIKQKALSTETQSLPNLTFLPSDLERQSLAETLQKCPLFNPTSRTMFVAEGLLMYLQSERVRRLFQEINAASPAAGSSLVAFTFMEAREDRRIRFRESNPLVDWWLQWQGESFRWSISPDELPAFLSKTGWRISALVSGDALRDRFPFPVGLRDAPLAKGEWLVLAEASSTP